MFVFLSRGLALSWKNRDGIRGLRKASLLGLASKWVVDRASCNDRGLNYIHEKC